GFGSMDSQDSVRMTSIAIEALDLCGCRGVFATGWGGLQTDALPNTIFPIREIPHAWLFPRMAALVHHGGMGTTAAGLRAGIPSVILPIGADQFFWANRVQKLQVGLSKNYFKKTTKQLASVITKAMRDPILRENAAVLGEKIRAEQGVEQAVKLIKEYCPI
ncbi:MAG: glycosyltransferase, partial [Chloroflexota bacterium]